MIHIKTRSQLINHVASTTNDPGIRDSLNHGHVKVWGRFTGGWVLEAYTCRWDVPTFSSVVIGIKPDGTCGQRLISGRLSAIPWADYIGGEHGIDRGDFPMVALQRREIEKEKNEPTA